MRQSLPLSRAAGLVLAGGRSTRFGSDKALALLGDKTLLERAVDALRLPKEMIAVSARAGSAAESLAVS